MKLDAVYVNFKRAREHYERMNERGWSTLGKAR